MDTIEIEREVFDALIERVDFLHTTVKALYNELRDKKLSDWLNTKQTCDYLHISERKLRTLKERGKIEFSHLGRLSQFKGDDIHQRGGSRAMKETITATDPRIMRLTA